MCESCSSFSSISTFSWSRDASQAWNFVFNAISRLWISSIVFSWHCISLERSAQVCRARVISASLTEFFKTLYCSAFFAWRDIAFSWLLTSRMISLTRSIFCLVCSILRTADSLRLLYLEIPAASSINCLRSSGFASTRVATLFCSTRE